MVITTPIILSESNIRMLDCIVKEDQLIDRAIELGLSGVALTDHETVAGHIKALKYMKSLKSKAEKILKENPEDEWSLRVKNFKLGLGNEIYLCRDNLNAKNYVKGEDGFWHFILIAKDKIGNDQIRKLSSRAWEHSFVRFMERVPTYYADVEEIIGVNPGHVIATTACLGGQLNHFFKTNNIEGAENFCYWCRKMFGKENFYIELQPNDQPEQIQYNKWAVTFAEELNIPLTVSTDTHYLNKEDREIHKSFLNAGEGDRETDSFYSFTYLMDYEEVFSHLSAYLSPDLTRKILKNTLTIQDSIEEYDLAYKQIIPRIPLNEKIFNPLFNYSNIEQPWIQKFLNSEYEEDRYFAKAILQKAKEENLFDDQHLERLNQELEEMWIVSDKIEERLSAYFITVQKIIDIAWTDGDTLVGPWRGSVGSMLSAYLMGIIQRDPLKSPTPLPYWRFCSRGRAELADVDIDTQASKREKFIQAVEKYFNSIGGELTCVATFGTETSKAALLTACRGLGYEPEMGAYLSSLIPIDRGFVRSLHQCWDGDEEKGYAPIPQFVTEMKKNPDVWAVAQKIEGLISRRGVHASGVILTNGPFSDLGATMKSPRGVRCSQWELHDEEYAGHIKYDFLTVDALDRIRTTLELLLTDKRIEWQGSLKETYWHYLNPDILDYKSPKMWDLVGENKIVSLFQFDTPVGLQAAKQIKPESLLELAQANSLMRLIPEKGKKTPVEEFVEYKQNPGKLKDDIYSLDATEEEKEILYNFMKVYGGVLDSQESLMLATMLPFTNYNVDEANKVRKVVAKKKIKEIEELREAYYARGKELGTSPAILKYIWEEQATKQMGYAFSIVHTIAYSTVAIQELNLAYSQPVLYWDTACLIVDSGGLEVEEDEDFEEESDDSEEESEEEVKIKKPKKAVNYGKISSAIGKMRSFGVTITPPNILESEFTFKPDLKNNTIIYGLKGIAKINTSFAKTIIANRPYTSFEDFCNKCHPTTLQAINLIKSGAFDCLGEDRETLLDNFIYSISDCKKRLTLQNMPTLIKMAVIPDTYEDIIKCFNFTKYVRKNCKKGTDFLLDDYSQNYICENFDPDILRFDESGNCLLDQKVWDKIYKGVMNGIRDFLKKDETLLALNSKLVQEKKDKYCEGNRIKWEMDSIGFYNEGHELDFIDLTDFDLIDFNSLPEEPLVERYFKKDDRSIPLYKLFCIAGTVIEKNKLKNIVTLLTPEGVVKVKIYKSQFVKYDKTIFEKNPETGKKKVIEKSWFTRGNKILIQGIRRGDSFIPKTYKGKGAPITLIDNINFETGTFNLITERNG